MFRDRSLLGRCFRGYVLPVLEYCSAVWCSDADTHLKLLDRAVSGAQFLTGHVWALPGPCVPVRVTRDALVAHRYTYAPLRFRTCSTAGLLFPSRCTWNDLSNPVFDGVGLAGFKSRANASLLA